MHAPDIFLTTFLFYLWTDVFVIEFLFMSKGIEFNIFAISRGSLSTVIVDWAAGQQIV